MASYSMQGAVSVPNDMLKPIALIVQLVYGWVVGERAARPEEESEIVSTRQFCRIDRRKKKVCIESEPGHQNVVAKSMLATPCLIQVSGVHTTLKAVVIGVRSGPVNSA
jgi:hypothetical protein